MKAKRENFRSIVATFFTNSINLGLFGRWFGKGSLLQNPVQIQHQNLEFNEIADPLPVLITQQRIQKPGQQ